MSRKKQVSLWVMGLLYLAAGINHFISPAFYKAIMPPWLPLHDLLIQLSGAAEIILGILVLVPATRVFAAWGIILLLVAVFPANIQMLLNYLAENNPYTWVAILRLPLQMLLIWWAYKFTRTGKQGGKSKK